MATKIFPSANDIAPVTGGGKVMTEVNLKTWVGNNYAANLVITGLTASAGSGLNLNVAAGNAMISGRWVNKDAQESVTLTDNTTNHVFLKLTLDGSSNVTGAALDANTTGTPPADSVKIAQVVTSGGTIQQVTDYRNWAVTLKKTSSGGISAVDHGGVETALARLAANETITGSWVFNTLLQVPAGLKVNNTVADFDLADGRDTYIDSGHASIYVSQAGAGDFSSEAGHLIIQPRMVGGGLYRDIIFAGGNTTADALMTITGEGKVGVGTTNPVSAFEISAVTPYASISNTSTNILINDVIGVLNFHSKDASSTSTGGVGSIQVRASTNYDTASTPSYMAFYTHSNVNNDSSVLGLATEKMRILPDGSLGLGITSPDSLLHVNAGSAGTITAYANTQLTVENSTTNYISMLAPKANSQGILFGNPTDGASDGGILYNNNTRQFNFQAGGIQANLIKSNGQFENTLATGTAPLVVASTTVVSNLNADTVDGWHASGSATSGVLGGAINVNTTAAGNVNNIETDLMSYTIPANTLNANGRVIRVRAWGTYANNSNTKQISVYFGGSSFSFLSTTLANKNWNIDYTIVRKGGNSQEGVAAQTFSTDKLEVKRMDYAVTDTSAIIFKLTGIGDVTNDIVQTGMVIELLN